MVTEHVDTWKRAWHTAFRWRFERSWVTMSLLAASFAVLTGWTSYLELHLPWSPVPVTLQTFWVLLTGVLLGKRYGPLSQLMYVGAGVGGLPFYAGGAAGLGVLTGFTGGYLLGFVLAAALVGWLTDTFLEARSFRALLGIMLVGEVIILGLGALWLGVVLDLSVADALVKGALVFVPGDIVKAAAAAGLAASVVPRTAFGPEQDA